MPDANAMTLATATADGVPSARIVLLKGFDQRGFVFFTDYRSRKGAELEANPRAALVFYWAELDWQVRITGGVALVSHEESEVYFRTRPLGSRLGAWASHQSRVIPGRAALEAAIPEVCADTNQRFRWRTRDWHGHAPAAGQAVQGNRTISAASAQAPPQRAPCRNVRLALGVLSHRDASRGTV